MRSRVESRLRKETGKTHREIRRAKKLKKKLMTEEERHAYNLRRAKKKVALLLQKLKKYELPELPAPRHDPELLTPEQLQAYKKIGFRNRNYVPVGVRGVFGGVVQNMHLHWKFHETVQVCCDNFPKEKIKEMASMLARLSGGIVINIHNVKTIIMFRGRNYRQPKNLIPINTLTKRKALFKARFEQALESQKLNIKKYEQELRRKGINPDDPANVASVQRVASTFFNAIDKKEGSPYVFREDKLSELEPVHPYEGEDAADSDQEELERFIAEIEEAADKEFAREEEAEREELGKIRYLNRDDMGGKFRGLERTRNEVSDGEEEYDSDDGRAPTLYGVQRVERGQKNNFNRVDRNDNFRRNARYKGELPVEDYESESTFSDVEDAMWQSDDEEELEPVPSTKVSNYKSSSDEEDGSLQLDQYKSNGRDFANHRRSFNRNDETNSRGNSRKPKYESEDALSEPDFKMWESDDGEELASMSSTKASNYKSSSDEDGSLFMDRYKSNGGDLAEHRRPFNGNDETNSRGNSTKLEYESEDVLSEPEFKIWELDDEEELNTKASSSFQKGYTKRNGKDGVEDKNMKSPKQCDETWESD